MDPILYRDLGRRLEGLAAAARSCAWFAEASARPCHLSYLLRRIPEVSDGCSPGDSRLPLLHTSGTRNCARTTLGPSSLADTHEPI
jgi:hypothetical protein